jgi:nicotinamidase-related amidase
LHQQQENNEMNGYASDRTALLLVDPYNDFLSEGGKLWPRVKAIAAEENLLEHLRQIVTAVRAAKIPVFIVPHHRWEQGDYEDWDHPSPYQLGGAKRQTFAKGSWGGEWHPDFAPQPGDIVVKEHWGSSGFANTDLDLRLKQKRIDRVIVVGLLANTCIESTSRFAFELGYHVTLVKDATAAFTREMMRAAHELNGPTFAHAILTTEELIAALPPVSSPRLSDASPRKSDFAERFAEVNGVRLRYLIGGKGSPVVLLHGYAETSHMWHPIMPMLAEHHTVIVPDLRGAGESSRPESGYDKKNMAVDIHELVKSLGYDRAAIVGKLVVNMYFSTAGNLDLRVRDHNNNIIATATQSVDVPGLLRENLVIPVVSQQQYFLEAFSAAGQTNDYSLEIENFAAPVPTKVTSCPLTATDEPPALLLVADNVWALISTPLSGDRTTLSNGGIIAGRNAVLAIEGFNQPAGAAWLGSW